MSEKKTMSELLKRKKELNSEIEDTRWQLERAVEELNEVESDIKRMNRFDVVTRKGCLFFGYRRIVSSTGCGIHKKVM